MGYIDSNSQAEPSNWSPKSISNHDTKKNTKNTKKCGPSYTKKILNSNHTLKKTSKLLDHIKITFLTYY